MDDGAKTREENRNRYCFGEHCDRKWRSKWAILFVSRKLLEEVASLDEEIRQLRRHLAQKLHLQN